MNASRTHNASDGLEAYVRDHHTLELARFHAFPEPGTAPAWTTLDLYLFVPASFGAGPSTWPAEMLYRQSKIAVRLRAKDITLEELADLESPRNPAVRLLERMEERVAGVHRSGLVPLARMFGADVSDVLRDEVKALKTQLDVLAPEDAHTMVQHIEELCASALKVLDVLDTLRRRAMRDQSIHEPGLLATITFAEEYSSALIDEQLSKLGMFLNTAENLRDGHGTVLRMNMTIAHTLDVLGKMRRSRGFITPDVGKAELYGYRLGLLKKELQQSLYVDTRPSGRDPFVANSAAMVAAALAATWALLAQVPLITGTLWSWQGLIFGLGAIFAYVLKDRIKDIVKRRLVKRWKHWDNENRILGGPLSNLGWGHFSGRARERVQWRSVDDVPKDVRRIRRFHRTVRSAAADLERVLHYRREVSLSVADPVPPAGFGLQELIRIRLADLLRRLDDPIDNVTFYSRIKRRFVTRDIPRVYHLNLICLVTSPTGQRTGRKFRAVVNQKEVVRLESVRSNALDAPGTS
jgi:hypothetical protein